MWHVSVIDLCLQNTILPDSPLHRVEVVSVHRNKKHTYKNELYLVF